MAFSIDTFLLSSFAYSSDNRLQAALHHNPLEGWYRAVAKNTVIVLRIFRAFLGYLHSKNKRLRPWQQLCLRYLLLYFAKIHFDHNYLYFFIIYICTFAVTNFICRFCYIYKQIHIYSLFSLSAVSLSCFFISESSSGMTSPRCLLESPISFCSGKYPTTFTESSFSIRGFMMS